ncbi:hypothetical protein BRADI_1g10750v3, partial [Brachypodium distachyon]
TTTIPDNDNTDEQFPEDEVLSQPHEPYLGMRFDTLSCAKDHYNAYALVNGFSIRSSTSRRSLYTNEVEKQLFVCNKFRKPKVDGKKAPKQRRRETIKGTNCKARLIVKLMDSRWQVVYFIAKHNHPLITRPSLTKYLRSHQGIPKEEENFLRILHDSNLETGRMMQLMSSFYGSSLLVPYTTKAISNYRSRMRTQTHGGDMAETISYFTVLLDEEQRVQNLLWVDGAARKAYEDAYSDCISFDTTYLTNQYNMPFASFIGINRHGQSFMLGCGFLRDEKATSFDWLFETYLDAMHGKAPQNIITDQDWAMRASIAKVFPNTVHRNCRWHIMKKAQEKLGSFLGRRPELVAQFNEVVDYSLTPEEFEQSWAQMIAVHDVASNKHIAWLYNIRATWVPCYFKDCFFPFLQSTQHSEGFNAVLKRYVNPHNSILNFVQQYEKIHLKILVKEGGNDYRTDHVQVRPWSSYPIERQALNVYTRDIYYRFREEFEKIGRYDVRQLANDIYELYPNRKYCCEYGTRTYKVTARVEEASYSCECCNFQKDGLLCCHILKIFTHCSVDEISQDYIIKRWKQQAIREEVAREEEKPDKVAREACGTDAGKQMVEKHVRAMRTELSHLNKTRKTPKKAATTVPTAKTSTTAPTQPVDASAVRNPDRSATKGKTRKRRFENALELRPKRRNKCALCGSEDHNQATCLSKLV